MSPSPMLVLALAWLLAACAPTPAPAPRPPSALPNVQVLNPPLVIPGLERQRTLRLYLPPSYAQSERRYPVIYMHDGQNLFDDATSYAGEWGVDETLNQLARTSGFEAIVVGIDNGLDKRMNELNPWPHPEHGAGEGDAYLNFIVEVVKPMIDRRLRTLPEARHTAILGSSMGGLISHYAIQRHPQVFGKAGIFSPAYWTAPLVFAHAERHTPPPTARLYLYMGGREGRGMVDDVQRMHAQLASRPYAPALTLRIVPKAEHNEAAWRQEFERAVRWLYELPN
ncbi:alpha/beta hydrolase [Aquincola sp. S2]|uniref:Alpha/beta hydrolase n=1 Tax=Pseudaquabacterium terrae TaxID=2732868 RepID=A0ABX2ES37_9BURK|nr:alpha/beta hydrolase-fold protein [Aquabacterium terrae]NRF71476.1 alpha/beta hydrolase [Aquabacterium terrae]